MVTSVAGPIARIVVMGVAGSGKTTIGSALATLLGLRFVDGDGFHDAAAKAKMHRGDPLTEAERGPWLDRLHALLVSTEPPGIVLACSALTDASRQHLAGSLPVRFVYLHGDPALLRERLAKRHGHFAGPALLPSQLATLEPPTDAISVDVAEPEQENLDRIAIALAAPGSPRLSGPTDAAGTPGPADSSGTPGPIDAAGTPGPADAADATGTP
jgi:gluconokinase